MLYNSKRSRYYEVKIAEVLKVAQENLSKNQLIALCENITNECEAINPANQDKIVLNKGEYIWHR